jgi:hypothetical protein
MSIELLDALRRLRTEGPFSTYAGICGNLPINSYQDEGVRLSALFRSWPKFSGSLTYPVPGVGDMSPHEAFVRIPNVWNGEYGALRRELLDHCINELAKELV